MIKQTENKNVLYVFTILLTIYLSKLFYLNSMSDIELMTIIPDDAFYYLQMVKMRSLHEFWSFDGHNPATGFHLLYGYFLLGLSHFVDIDNWRHLFQVVSLFSISALSAAGAFLFKTSYKLKPGIHNWLAPFALITPTMINIPFLMMESWLVILFAALSSYFIFKKNKIELSDKILLAALGLLLSLSRSDAGLIIGSYFGVSFFLLLLFKQHDVKLIFIRSTYTLIGAIIGLGILFFHNFLTSGELLQSSAQVKSHWSQLIGYNAQPSFDMAQMVLLPLFKKSSDTAQIIMVLIVSIYLIKKTLSNQLAPPFTITLYASLCTLIGYVLFYGANSQSLQLWYTANFLVPAALLISLLTNVLPKKSQKTLTIIFILFSTITTAKKYDDVIWNNQKQTYLTALNLDKEVPQDSKIAAWNAGILGYISNMGVINIDGLANDSSTPYILENKLFDYIASEDIDFIIDYKAMITDQNLKIRGGYNIEHIDKCLNKKNIHNLDDSSWLNSEMFIFKVDKKCINSKDYLN